MSLKVNNFETHYFFSSSTSKSGKIPIETIESLIRTDPILIYPDFEKPFLLTTDASNYALGAVLSQVHEGKDHPVAFASRTLNKHEVNYSTTEKEALAIMWAVEKFKPYLYGNSFTLVTDHKPLTFIKKKLNKKF